MPKDSLVARTTHNRRIPTWTDVSPAPFLFLNHDLEAKELKRQIVLMEKAGIRTFFLHPRIWLKTPYGSKDWLDKIETCLDKAKQQGMKVWLLDEDPYNSGAAGGEVMFQHPEFAAKRLFHYSFTADPRGELRGRFPGGRVMQAIAIRRVNGRIVESVDISDTIGVLRETVLMSEWSNSYYPGNATPHAHYRAEAFQPVHAFRWHCDGAGWSAEIVSAAVEQSDYRWGSFPDNLNRRSVECFLELTHERYRARFGRFWADVMPGIFTDELRVGASTMPYTDGLDAEFQKRNGYALQDRYVDLFLTRDQGSFDARRDYWATLHAMLQKNCLRPMKSWCRRHGVLLTGHFLAEDDPLGQTCAGAGNIYSNLRFLDVPGYDLVGPRVGDSQFPAYHLGAKLVASVAHQTGRRAVLGECFACTPWNYGLLGMKRTVNWLFAHGITWMNPHAFFYSIDGYRKYEAPKAFSFQDPLGRDYPHFQDYATRQGTLLVETRPCADTLVLYPASSFWRLLPAEEPAAVRLRNTLYQLIRHLIEARIAFDFVDETTLADSVVRNGKLKVGQQSYRALILPLAEPLLPATEKRLNKMRGQFPIVRHTSAGETLEALLKVGVLRTEACGEEMAPLNDLVVLHREHKCGPMEFLFNNSPKPLSVNLPMLPDCHAAIDDGSGSGWQSTGEGGQVSLRLGPYDAVSLLRSKKRLPVSGKWENPTSFGPCDLSFESHPQWDYLPPQPVIESITSWNIRTGRDTKPKQWKNHRFTLLRDLLGTESAYLLKNIVRPIFDTAPPVPSIYPVRAVFSTTFRLTGQQNDDGCALVMETETMSGDASVLLNGRLIPASQFRRRRVYDPANLVASLDGLTQQGVNRIEVVFENASEFDGLRSPVFLMQHSSL